MLSAGKSRPLPSLLKSLSRIASSKSLCSKYEIMLTLLQQVHDCMFVLIVLDSLEYNNCNISLKKYGVTVRVATNAGHIS